MKVSESLVFTLSGGVVVKTTDHLHADMAGLNEGQLVLKMKDLGFTPLLRVTSLQEDLKMPVLISFTKRKIHKNELPAQIEGM